MAAYRRIEDVTGGLTANRLGLAVSVGLLFTYLQYGILNEL